MSSEDTSLIDSLSSSIQTDLPTIDASVKNLISLLVGKSYISDGIDLKSAMTCAKVLLQNVQRFKLLDVESYCAKYPQKDSQSGLSRLDEVCQYKAIIRLRDATYRQNAKATKLFGKLFFVWTSAWPLIRDQIETELIANHSNHVTLDEMSLFLDTYERSLGPEGK